MAMNLEIEVPSHSNPRVRYKITRHASTGAWSCTCPSWMFQGRSPEARTCKHITSVALDLAVHVGERAQARV